MGCKGSGWGHAPTFDYGMRAIKLVQSAKFQLADSEIGSE